MRDIRELERGSMIEGLAILEWLGEEADALNPHSPPPHLRLADRLERELHKIGRPWTVRAGQHEDDDRTPYVRVLTDSEAVAFNARRHRYGLNKFRRALKCLKGVDKSQLEAREREDYDRLQHTVAAQCIAIHRADKDPAQFFRPVEEPRYTASNLPKRKPLSFRPKYFE